MAMNLVDPQATTRRRLPDDPENDPGGGNGMNLGGGPIGDPQRMYGDPPPPPPLAQPQATTVAPQAPPVTPPAGQDMTPQEAAAAGLGWVDKYNPNYGKPGFVGSVPAAPPPPTAPQAPPPAPPPTAPGGIVTTPEPAAPVAPASPLQKPYQDAVLKMLTDNQQAPSLSDPTLKAQADAFSVGQTRARDAARAAMAERMAQEGGPGVDSGAFNNDLAGLFQQQGEAEGQFNAGLVGNELQNRRNQLMQAATLAGNQLTAQDQQALQRELANLDAQIKREGMAQQGGQFSQSLAEQKRQADVDAELKKLGINTQSTLGQGDLSLRDKLGSGQLNLGLLSALMQNQQAGNSLGAQVGMFNSSQNQNALLQMLGMLG